MWQYFKSKVIIVIKPKEGAISAPSFYQSTIMGFPHVIAFFFLLVSLYFYIETQGLFYTENLNSMVSPSLTTYSLPSSRSNPLALALA